jgi:hypothetical protein
MHDYSASKDVCSSKVIELESLEIELQKYKITIENMKHDSNDVMDKNYALLDTNLSSEEPLDIQLSIFAAQEINNSLDKHLKIEKDLRAQILSLNNSDEEFRIEIKALNQIISTKTDELSHLNSRLAEMEILFQKDCERYLKKIETLEQELRDAILNKSEPLLNPRLNLAQINSEVEEIKLNNMSKDLHCNGLIEEISDKHEQNGFLVKMDSSNEPAVLPIITELKTEISKLQEIIRNQNEIIDDSDNAKLFETLKELTQCNSVLKLDVSLKQQTLDAAFVVIQTLDKKIMENKEITKKTIETIVGDHNIKMIEVRKEYEAIAASFNANMITNDNGIHLDNTKAYKTSEILEKTISKHEATLNGYHENELESLKAENCILQSQISTTLAFSAGQSEREIELLRELDDTEVQLQKLEDIISTNNNNFELALETAQIEINHLKSNMVISKPQSDRETKLLQDLDDAEIQLQKLEDIVSTNNNKFELAVENSEKEIEHLKSKLSLSSTQSDRETKLLQDLDVAEIQLQKLEDILSTNNNKFELAVESAEKEIEHLKSKLALSSTQSDRETKLLQELDDAEVQLQKLEDILSTNNNKFELAVESAEKEIEHLKSKLALSSTQSDRETKLLQELDDAEVQLQKLEDILSTNNNKFELTVESAEKEIEHLKSKLALSVSHSDRETELSQELNTAEVQLLKLEDIISTNNDKFALAVQNNEREINDLKYNLPAHNSERETELLKELKDAEVQLQTLEEIILTNNKKFELVVESAEKEIEHLKCNLPLSATKSDRESELLLELDAAEMQLLNLENIISTNNTKFELAVASNEGEIKQLKIELDELRSMYYDPNIEISLMSANAKIIELDQIIINNRYEYQAFLVANDNEIADYHAEISNLKLEVLSLLKDTGERLVERDSLVLQLENEKLTAINIKESLADADSNIALLENIIEENRKHYNEFLSVNEKELSDSHAEISTLKCEVSLLLERIKTAAEPTKSSSNAEIVNEDIKNLQQIISDNTIEFQNQLDTLKLRIESLLDDVSNLQTSNNELIAIKEERTIKGSLLEQQLIDLKEEADHKISQSNNLLGEIINEKETLVLQLEEARLIAYEWEDYATKQYAEAKDQFEAELLNSKLNILDNGSEETKSLKLVISDLQTELDQFHSSKLQYDTVVGQLESQILENEKLQSELASLRNGNTNTTDQQKSELSHLSGQIESLVIAVRDRESTIAEQDTQHDILKSEFFDLSGQLESLNIIIKNGETRIAEQDIIGEQQQSVINQLTLQCETLSSKELELRTRIRDVDAKYDICDRDLEKMTTKQHVLQKKYEISQAKAFHLQDELDMLQNEFKTQVELFVELQTKFDSGKIGDQFSMTIMETERLKLEAEKSGLQHQVSELSQVVEDLTVQSHDTIAEWTEYSSGLEKERDQLNMDIANLYTDQAFLKSKYEESYSSGNTEADRLKNAISTNKKLMQTLKTENETLKVEITLVSNSIIKKEVYFNLQ